MDKDKGLRRLCWTAILLSVASLMLSGALAYVSHLERLGLARQLREIAVLIDASATAEMLLEAAENLRRAADELEK